MKQKTIKFSKILLLSLLFIFVSCDKDASIETEENLHEHGTNPNQVSMEFFKEVTHIENLELFLKEKTNATGLMSRRESYSFSDFTIDTKVINQCRLKNGEIAFSFKLYPKEGIAERDELFNLVITRVDEQWQSSIFLLIQNTDTNASDYFSEIEEVFTSVGLPENFSFRTSSRFRGNKIWHCPRPKGECDGPNGSCDLCFRCLTIVVESAALPPLEEYDDISLVKDPTFVYNTGGGNAQQSQEKTPCETLKNQSIDNLNFEKKLDSIKQRVLTINPNRDMTETLISVSRSGDNYNYSATNTTVTANGLLTVAGEMTSLDVAVMHNHPVGTIPIFSHVDIVDLFIAYNFVSQSRKNEFTSYLVSFNNTTYALRMENTEALSVLLAGLDLDTPQGRIDANDRVFKIFQKFGLKKENNPPYTQAMAEALLINVLNDPKMGGGNGINLYRKDANDWGKLEKNGNGIEKVPCN